MRFRNVGYKSKLDCVSFKELSLCGRWKDCFGIETVEYRGTSG